jgi:hypothetical protein
MPPDLGIAAYHTTFARISADTGGGSSRPQRIKVLDHPIIASGDHQLRIMLRWRLCGEHCSGTAISAFPSRRLQITWGQIQGNR